MGRKRSLKKLRARQEEILGRFEGLHREGADAELLAAVAAARGALDSTQVRQWWREAAERSLLQSLEEGDLPRLERLMGCIRGPGRELPLASLAGAVLALAAGELEPARARLAACARREEGVFPPGLIPALQALAGDPWSLATHEPPPGLADLSRWRELVDAGSSTAGDLPTASRSGLKDPLARASWGLCRELRRLAANGCEATTKIVSGLRRALTGLRAAAPPRLELVAAIDTAERWLGLVGEIAAVEARLARRSGEEASASRALLGALRGPGALLAEALAASPPPVLAPLHRALRLAWRRVLSRVAAADGAAGLAALAASRPELVALDLELAAGVSAGISVVRLRTQALQHLRHERYGELARLLAARSQEVTAPSDLAALWGLELWAYGRQDQTLPVGAFDDAGAEPVAHRVLVRLQRMASMLAARFPAEQRAGVARVLLDELLAVQRALPPCEHFTQVALALLAVLPGDIGLLLIGLAGAHIGGERRALTTLQERIAARGLVSAAERQPAVELLASLSDLEPPVLVKFLAAARPLFSDEQWLEASTLVACRVGSSLVRDREELTELQLEDPVMASELGREITRDLERLRAVLAPVPALATIALVLRCFEADPPAAARALESFLATEPALEDVLGAFRLVHESEARISVGLYELRRQLAQVAVQRLDGRWRVWVDDFAALAAVVGLEDLRPLQSRLRRLRRSAEVDAEGEVILADMLDALRQILGGRRSFLEAEPRGDRQHAAAEPGSGESAKGGRRKSGHGRSAASQLELEF